MKKAIIIIGALAFVIILSVCLFFCTKKEDKLKEFSGITFSDEQVYYDGHEHSIVCNGVPEGATVSYSGNKGTEDGEYNAAATVTQDGYKPLNLNAKLTIILGKDRVVEAKDAMLNNAKQNYNFKISLTGDLAVAGFSGAVHGNYDGQYRYDGDTDNLLFKRVTSGLLLYDSTEYIYNSGSSKIKIVADEDGTAKSISVVPKEEQKLKLLNIPFVEILKHTDVENLSDIIKTGGVYQYKTNLKLTSENEYVQKVLGLIEKIGLSVKVKDVLFTNPVSGVELNFNLNNDKTLLTDFTFSFTVSFPLKAVQTTLILKYEQKADDKAIVMPSTKEIISKEEDIATEITGINNAIEQLRNSDTYSLDLEAVNEFDPGWNVRATVDKYISRLYKNTNEGRVDFNQSYEYKAHSEEDGAETYKYTYGNIADGSVYLVSRKGKNNITPAEGITLDSQFNYMVGAALLEPEHVECIKKVEKEGSTFYHIFMDKESKLSIQKRIIEMINSNNAEGVIDVDNYFNEDENIIKDASIVVEKKDNKIVSVKIETDIRYYPVSGDYVDEQVTLTDTILLKINDNIDKASKYIAPKKTNTTLGDKGLNNASFYIL